MNKRILSLILHWLFLGAPPLFLRRSKHLLHPSRKAILGSSTFPGRGRLPVRQIKMKECTNCLLRKEL